jgi:hypothetical protein
MQEVTLLFKLSVSTLRSPLQNKQILSLMISYNTHNKLSVVQEQNAYLLKNKQCMLENQQKVKIIKMYEVSNYMKNRNMSIIK